MGEENEASRPGQKGREGPGAENVRPMPMVCWAGRSFSRLVLGHNPLKGNSHQSEALSGEMRAWHANPERVLDVMVRAEECGIKALQFGGEAMHKAIAEFARRGGKLAWIATFYGNDKGNLAFGDRTPIEEELKRILSVSPPPFGIQHFGENTDRMFFEGRLDEVGERLKRFRETGLLTGLCTHLPEVVMEAQGRGWDLDFFQTSFYTAYAGVRKRGIQRKEEIFDDEDRKRMIQTIRQTPKPCLAFKILGAGRKCQSEAQWKEAFRFALENIKPVDALCVGMWQKYGDQVSQNASLIRELSGPG